jgi:hypothetical protein
MKYLPLVRFSLVLLAALGFQACETDITDDVKINTTPDLVVTSFISPQDTALEVYVTKSRPVVGQVHSPDASLVTNATVRISQGGQSVLLTYHPERRLYRAKASLLPVLAGQTYTLSVTTPDHYTVTGNCTVPLTTGVAVTDLAHSIRKHTWWTGGEYDEHVLTFKWQDAPGRENFYHPVAEREYRNPDSPQLLRDGMNGDGKVYFSDQSKDGLVFTASRSFSMMPGQPDPRPANLNVYLAVTDRAYYLYHQSLDQHEDSNGNPFAEPVLIYSNVTGGLGIFSAYNQIKATYRLN